MKDHADTRQYHKARPCGNCPFKKTTMKGWLGEKRMEEILNDESFVCHKTVDTPNPLQCAGHMLLSERNLMYRMLQSMGKGDDVQGRELLFDTPEECIKHHGNEKGN